MYIYFKKYLTVRKGGGGVREENKMAGVNEKKCKKTIQTNCNTAKNLIANETKYMIVLFNDPRHTSHPSAPLCNV